MQRDRTSLGGSPAAAGALGRRRAHTGRRTTRSRPWPTSTARCSCGRRGGRRRRWRCRRIWGRTRTRRCGAAGHSGSRRRKACAAKAADGGRHDAGLAHGGAVRRRRERGLRQRLHPAIELGRRAAGSARGARGGRESRAGALISIVCEPAAIPSRAPSPGPSRPVLRAGLRLTVPVLPSAPGSAHRRRSVLRQHHPWVLVLCPPGDRSSRYHRVSAQPAPCSGPRDRSMHRSGPRRAGSRPVPALFPDSAFQPAVPTGSPRPFEPPTRPQARGLAGDRARRVDADPRADRQRQDAGRVPLVHRPADVRAGAADATQRCRVALRLAAQGAGRRRRAQPARAARRHRATSRAAAATPFHVPGDRDPHRRHAGRRARALPARAGRHPDHHARVALPAAHLERARARCARSTRSSSTRSTRSCRPSAARTSRSRSSGSSALTRPAAAAHRPLGDAAPARRGRALPRRRRSRERAARGRDAPRRRRLEPAVDARDRTTSSRATRRAPRTGRSRSSTPARTKTLELRIEVPVEDMARLGEPVEHPERAGVAQATGARRRSGRRSTRACSSSIRAHRSTLIFVNSRRLAERLAGALNELAGETLVRAHHGSLARAQRIEIEDRAQGGARCAALVATSSLELGIDMGAIDLVVQIEAPPSVASGLQRIGRAGPPGRRRQPRRHLPEVPRRPASRAPPSPRAMHEGAGRGDALSAQPARRARAADRRDGRDGRLGRRRAVRARPPRRAVRRARARASSTACSTCSRAATRPTSSPSCGRASPGTASTAR